MLYFSSFHLLYICLYILYILFVLLLLPLLYFTIYLVYWLHFCFDLLFTLPNSFSFTLFYHLLYKFVILASRYNLFNLFFRLINHFDHFPFCNFINFLRAWIILRFTIFYSRSLVSLILCFTFTIRWCSCDSFIIPGANHFSVYNFVTSSSSLLFPQFSHNFNHFLIWYSILCNISSNFVHNFNRFYI